MTPKLRSYLIVIITLLITIGPMLYGNIVAKKGGLVNNTMRITPFTTQNQYTGEAVRIVGEYAGDIHLLITDVVMPEMNGQDLAINLQSHYPQLKCLFMSGYTSDVITHRGVLDEGGLRH